MGSHKIVFVAHRCRFFLGCSDSRWLITVLYFVIYIELKFLSSYCYRPVCGSLMFGGPFDCEPLRKGLQTNG